MAKLKLLYIEDGKFAADAVELLTMMGCEVVYAADFNQARLLFTTSRPDVILTDHECPGGDGLEFIDYVRKSNRPEVPVIWHSGNTGIDLKDVVEKGANYAFRKPIDFVDRLGPIFEVIAADIARKKS